MEQCEIDRLKESYGEFSDAIEDCRHEITAISQRMENLIVLRDRLADDLEILEPSEPNFLPDS